MTVILTFLPLVILIVTLVDIITRDEWQVKHLPKLVWILLVVFLPIAGAIIWFAVGREYSRPVSYPEPRRDVPAPSSTPSRTERELAALDAEIAADRIRRLEAEVERKRRDAPE